MILIGLAVLILFISFDDYKIIDSAQKVDKDQFKKEANDEDLMIFSFYPTKPVGSSDGGIIVSNDYEKIRWFKEATMNGQTYAHNNWDRTIKFPGYKMYMNSIQCYIANENLKILDFKKMKLSSIREKYNKSFGYNNTSDHLYRIEVGDRDKFIKKMGGSGIICVFIITHYMKWRCIVKRHLGLIRLQMRYVKIHLLYLNELLVSRFMKN